MKHFRWTVEWRDSKTDQLISPETPIKLQNRPTLSIDAQQITTANGNMWLPGVSHWQDMNVSYESQEEELGSIFLLRWISEGYQEKKQFNTAEYADVILKYYKYKTDELIEEWYLEKCFVNAVNFGWGNPTFGNYDSGFDVTFKCEKAHYISHITFLGQLGGSPILH